MDVGENVVMKGRCIGSFIHPVNVLNIYYVSGTVLGAEDAAQDIRGDTALSLKSL